MNVIYLNSPYMLQVDGVSGTWGDLSGLRVNLWIYNGTQANKAGDTPTLSLESTNPIDGEDMVIDIASVSKDYIESSFNGSYSQDCIWVDYQIYGLYTTNGYKAYGSYTSLVGFDGYTYFEEGQQSTNLSDPSLMVSSDFMSIPKENTFKIPVYSGTVSSVSFLRNGEAYFSQPISTSVESSEQIVYADSRGWTFTNYKNKVDYLDASFEANKCAKQCYSSFDHTPDKAIVSLSDGTSKVIDIETLYEKRYTPIKLSFLNKFGAIKDLYFFKRSDKSMSVSREEFNSNIRNYSIQGDVSRHRKQTFNVNGVESMTLNTGYISDRLNKDFYELFLSEKVWIDLDGKILPVNVSRDEFLERTHLNEGLINYTITVQFAYNKINRVR